MRQGITIDKKIMRQGIMWKDILRVLLEQWILAKLYATWYAFGIFYVTGYRVWKDLPHTPVTSLVKYLPKGKTFRERNFRDLAKCETLEVTFVDGPKRKISRG